jgi:predicted DNA-binding transcriptional regulator AlpA
MPTATAARTRPAEYLKLPEVLAEIGVTRSTFYEWRAKKTAPRCHKLPNGELRVSREDLDDWWAAQEEAN